TQLSVNASTAADFWGTQNAGVNYGLLYTAYGMAGIIGPRVGSALFVRYHNYEAAFHTAAALAAIALVCELLARRPAGHPRLEAPWVRRGGRGCPRPRAPGRHPPGRSGLRGLAGPPAAPSGA